MTGKITIAALLTLLAPRVRAAEPAEKPAGEPSAAAVAAPSAKTDGQPDGAAPPPAAAPTPAPARPPLLTWEPGAWLSTVAWTERGAVNASDLPRFALTDSHERASGLSVKQSRIRLGVALPDDGGLLGGASLKGLVEVDFAGGYAGSDEAQPIPRLRHAYVQATWKELGNLTLLAGQTTDIFHGSVGAVSLGHVSTPRFSGAGYLHRRAPQLRLQGELGGDLAFGWQIGALSPADKATQTASSTSVGYRSAQPDLEARLALLLRGASPVKVELGVGGRYAQEKWLLAGVEGTPDKKVKSQAVGADLKIEAPYVTLVGGAFAGENLDVASSLAPGVKTAATSGNLTAVKSVPTRGAWGQVQLTPVKGLQLLAGAGVEAPNRKDLPATVSLNSVAFPSIDRNLQLSAGAIVHLTSKWRAGLELTRYQSHGVDGHTSRSHQLELSTLLVL